MATRSETGYKDVGISTLPPSHTIKIVASKKLYAAVGILGIAAGSYGSYVLLRRETNQLSRQSWNEPSKIDIEKINSDKKSDPVKAVWEMRQLADVAKDEKQPNQAKINEMTNSFASETIDNLLRTGNNMIDKAAKSNSIDAYKAAEQKYSSTAALANAWGFTRKATDAAQRASDTEKLLIENADPAAQTQQQNPDVVPVDKPSPVPPIPAKKHR